MLPPQCVADSIIVLPESQLRVTHAPPPAGRQRRWSPCRARLAALLQFAADVVRSLVPRREVSAVRVASQKLLSERRVRPEAELSGSCLNPMNRGDDLGIMPNVSDKRTDKIVGLFVGQIVGRMRSSNWARRADFEILTPQRVS